MIDTRTTLSDKLGPLMLLYSCATHAGSCHSAGQPNADSWAGTICNVFFDELRCGGLRRSKVTYDINERVNVPWLLYAESSDDKRG